MLSIYTSYKCRTCKKEFIVMAEEINKDRYLVCPHCSSQKVDKGKSTDDLRECMQERSYKRVNGVLSKMNTFLLYIRFQSLLYQILYLYHIV